MGGGNPFQDVSWQKPFGRSELGNALGASSDNAALTPTGQVKETGEQLVPQEAPLSGTSGSQYGMPGRNPDVIAAEEAQRADQERRLAEQQRVSAARQNEADLFTRRMSGDRGKSQLAQSLQGIQDQARRLRGRNLFGGQ